MKSDDGGLGGLGRIAAGSARHRGKVLIASFVLLALLGVGTTQLEFIDRPEDALPRGDPHTEAAKRLVERFPGASYASSVFVRVAPEKWDAANQALPNRLPFDQGSSDDADNGTGTLNQVLSQASGGQFEGFASGFPGPNNITDEVYMRAQEEVFEWLQERVPEVKWGITLASQIKLVNYTNSGVPNARAMDPATFAMPDTSPEGARQFNTAWQTYWAASPESIRSIVSHDWRTTRLVFLVAPDGKTLNEVGADIEAALDEYRAALRECDAAAPCDLEWNAFNADNVIFDPRVATSAAAYLTETTLDDLVVLGPIVAVVVGATLFLAFRRPSTVAAMLLPMGLAGVGVLGIFGLTRIPIHSVSLLVFPLLMGNGIDFAIHMASAYHNARGRGKDLVTAAGQAGRSAGTPLFIATMTTLVGMLLLVFAPNKMTSQLGLAILLGMALLLVVSLTTLPAALTFTRAKEARVGPIGRSLAANARFWHRNHILGVALVVVLVAAGAAGAARLDTLVIGTPAAYFPEGDENRQAFEQSNQQYYLDNDDLVTNILVFEGDLATPAAMQFLGRLEQELRALPFVRNDTTVSIHFALVSWIQVREGTAGAPLIIAQESAQEGSTFPDTEEEIRFLLDEMFATPLATYASFFTIPPTYDMGTLVVEIQQSDRFDDLETQWDALWATVAKVSGEVPEHGLEVTMAGATALGYLFAKEELPYLQVASLVGLAFTGLLVLAIRRSPRDALTVALVVGASGLWWLGTLAFLDIPLSIVLVVPVVMIAAIGSDYALHMRYALANEGARAWHSVGRAVFFSALTDLAAFLVFAQMRYGILRDATFATAAALGCCLLATLVIVPMMSRPTEMAASLEAP